MSFYDVLRRFELLSSLEGKDLSRYQDLCREAAEDIRARLKVPEESLADSKRLRLSYAAGALAFYKYCLLLSATEEYSLFPPNITCLVNREVIGIVTKIDREDARPDLAEMWLRLAGCTKVFHTSSKTGKGIPELLEYLTK